MSETTGHNAYLPGYAAHHLKHHEWRTAENSAPHLIAPLEVMAQKFPNMTLLDVGAGSGTITTTLARYMPQGTVTAVDLSPEIVERAGEYARSVGLGNRVKFEQASVYDLPFQDNSFDVVHAHQMLTHLDQPVAALQEMLRVCKPGGIVASREADMRMWCFHPQPKGLVAFHKLIGETMVAAGGHIDAGPRLVSWAMQAGARREQIQASYGTWCYSTPEERQLWGGTMAERIRNGEMRKKALKDGTSTEEAMEAMAKGWEEWIAAEDGSMGCMHGEILVTK